ncbi:NAD kinase 2, mitochondrial-like [Oppia nitens]|uniref:NAD kinase 2, mitochondrial-like n=1 Tax=Oppia nitens TaxID=1686743 RepID=UPI0023DA754C|nr:NAD kinase 2, mitochondrial-like [Oppia nitens]
MRSSMASNLMRRLFEINSIHRFLYPPIVANNIVRCYRFTPQMSANNEDQSLTDPIEPFRPKTALLLTKFSRYEFEKKRNPGLNEEELSKNLESRGSDYKRLISHHNIHKQSREHIVECLKKASVEVRVVSRNEYNDQNIDWADVIITSGGDGTFLMAASKINNCNKAVIGVNSDPKRSVGYLCLPKRYSNNFGEALRLLSDGQFRWKYRQRIRIILESENANEEPIELHDQQLKCPENRFLELDASHDSRDSKIKKNTKTVKKVLPYKALNEVFIGEAISSRVSYYEFAVNENKIKAKLKSSGLTISTGTGSTSWFFNINKVTPQCIQSLFQIINQEIDGQHLPENDSQVIERITNKFNNSLIFDPSEPLMAYAIRDPVVFGTEFHSNPRGFAKNITVKSRMIDANIVIDGGLSYKFNDGANVSLLINEEDALRTVVLHE